MIIIRLFKKVMSIGNEYSWMKWVQIAFGIIALIITVAFFRNFGSMMMSGGIIGVILTLIIFVVLFGPTLLIMMGAAALIGVAIGGGVSAAKQRKSFKETAQTGSAELMVLEKLRIKSQVLDFLFILAVIGLIILGIAVASPLFDAFGEAGLYGYMIIAGILLVAFLIAKAPVKKRYNDAFRELVVTKGLESVFDNLDFRPNEALDEAVVKASALFPRYDVYRGNDYLVADYSGRHFSQSDIHLQEERKETYRDSDGDMHTRTIYVTVFKGRLMVFNYDAISNEPVAVYDRQGGKPKGADLIQTELDAFNKRFYIIAPNPEAALRILTPPVLEGIVLAANKLKFPLYISFREDKLYVALANGDSFEAADGDATLSEQRSKVTDEIKSMLDLVDNLYLKKQS